MHPACQQNLERDEGNVHRFHKGALVLHETYNKEMHSDKINNT